MSTSELPETTLTLLRAVRTASGTTENNATNMVIIRNDPPNSGIHYLPTKSRYTSREIERAGISDLVGMFLFDVTRCRVERHFRDGIYDISGSEIKILK